MIRILFCPKDRFPPFRVDVSILFGRELVARGFGIDWVLQSDKGTETARRTSWDGGTAYVGKCDSGNSFLHRLRKHLLSITHDFMLLKLARGGNYDVIQVKDKVIAAWIGLIAARRSKTRFVYWLSFPFAESSTYLGKIGQARYPLLYRIRGWFLFRLLYRYILPRADHIFVQSDQMKADLESYGLDPRRMTPVPMGVDVADFVGYAKDPATFDAEAPVIGYLGSLASERRIDFVVRAVALVCEQIPNTRLLIVGGGDRPGDIEALHNEARRVGIADRIEITGFLPRKDALLRILESTVALSPFYPTPILNSTSPTKLIEYMGLGLPVVANDHPEQKLVIAESRAGYCVTWDERAFADAILRILADPAEAQQMGRRGQEYVAAVRDYKRIANMVSNEYQRIMREPPVSHR